MPTIPREHGMLGVFHASGPIYDGAKITWEDVMGGGGFAALSCWICLTLGYFHCQVSFILCLVFFLAFILHGFRQHDYGLFLDNYNNIRRVVTSQQGDFSPSLRTIPDPPLPAAPPTLPPPANPSRSPSPPPNSPTLTLSPPSGSLSNDTSPAFTHLTGGGGPPVPPGFPSVETGLPILSANAPSASTLGLYFPKIDKRDKYQFSKESPVWISKILAIIWPNMKEAIERSFHEAADNLFKRSCPDFLRSIKLTKCDMGNNPPVVLSVGVGSVEPVALDMCVSMKTNGEINILAHGIKAKLKAAVKDFSFSGVLRVRFSPLGEYMPMFKAATVSFISAPKVNMNLGAIGLPLTSIPGFEDWIMPFMMNALNNSMVWPSQYTHQITPLTDIEMVSCRERKPIGILFFTISASGPVPTYFSVFTKGLQEGLECQRIKGEVCSGSPFRGQFIIYDLGMESVALRAKGRHTYSHNLAKVVPGEIERFWVRKSDEEHGDVFFNAVFNRFEDDEEDEILGAESVEEEKTREKVPYSSTVISLFLLRFDGKSLPGNVSIEVECPYVEAPTTTRQTTPNPIILITDDCWRQVQADNIKEDEVEPVRENGGRKFKKPRTTMKKTTLSEVGETDEEPQSEEEEEEEEEEVEEECETKRPLKRRIQRMRARKRAEEKKKEEEEEKKKREEEKREQVRKQTQGGEAEGLEQPQKTQQNKPTKKEKQEFHIYQEMFFCLKDPVNADSLGGFTFSILDGSKERRAVVAHAKMSLASIFCNSNGEGPTKVVLTFPNFGELSFTLSRYTCPTAAILKMEELNEISLVCPSPLGVVNSSPRTRYVPGKKAMEGGKFLFSTIKGKEEEGGDHPSTPPPHVAKGAANATKRVAEGVFHLPRALVQDLAKPIESKKKGKEEKKENTGRKKKERSSPSLPQPRPFSSLTPLVTQFNCSGGPSSGEEGEAYLSPGPSPPQDEGSPANDSSSSPPISSSPLPSNPIPIPLEEAVSEGVGYSGGFSSSAPLSPGPINKSLGSFSLPEPSYSPRRGSSSSTSFSGTSVPVLRGSSSRSKKEVNLIIPKDEVVAEPKQEERKEPPKFCQKTSSTTSTTPPYKTSSFGRVTPPMRKMCSIRRDRKRAEQTDGKHNHARKVRHRKIKGSLASLTPWKGGGKGKLMSEEESGPDGPVITEKDMEEEEERLYVHLQETIGTSKTSFKETGIVLMGVYFLGWFVGSFLLRGGLGGIFGWLIGRLLLCVGLFVGFKMGMRVSERLQSCKDLYMLIVQGFFQWNTPERKIIHGKFNKFELTKDLLEGGGHMIEGGESGRRHRPRWLTFPGIEKEIWLNDFFEACWPQLSVALTNSLAPALNRLIESKMKFPMKKIFAGFKFEIEAGCAPWLLLGLKTYTQKQMGEKIVLDVNFCAPPMVSAWLYVKTIFKDFVLPLHLTNLVLICDFRLELVNFLPTWPCFSHLVISFLRVLEFDFAASYYGLPLLSLPPVKSLTMRKLQKVWWEKMYFPTKLEISILTERQRATAAWGPQGRPGDPEFCGVLRLKLERADGLRNTDFLSKSDPFVIGNFPGTQIDFRSAVKNNTLHPEWNETHEAYTVKREGDAFWQLFDETELNQRGGKIGDVEFEWEAEPFEWTRYEEPVKYKGAQKGRIFFSLVFFPLLPYEDPLASRLKYLPGENEVVVFLHIKKCRNLNYLSSRVSNPFVQVTVGNQTLKTEPKTSEAPTYLKRMTFFTTKNRLQERGVKINVMDGWSKVGGCRLSIKQLLEEDLVISLAASENKQRTQAKLEMTAAVWMIQNQDLNSLGEGEEVPEGGYFPGKGKGAENDTLSKRQHRRPHLRHRNRRGRDENGEQGVVEETQEMQKSGEEEAPIKDERRSIEGGLGFPRGGPEDLQKKGLKESKVINAMKKKKKINITVLNARALPKEREGINPFVVITLGKQKRETQKIPNSTDPNWNEKLTFFLDDNSNTLTQIQFQVYDHNLETAVDTLLGLTSASINELLNEQCCAPSPSEPTKQASGVAPGLEKQGTMEEKGRREKRAEKRAERKEKKRVVEELVLDKGGRLVVRVEFL